MPNVLRDAHLGSAFDAQLQYCLALLQREAPDGLDLLELGQAGGLWERRGSFRPSHSWDWARRIDQYGGGWGARKNQALESLGRDEEGIKDHSG